ncbi:membrane protein insertion efficiency factor YidD [Rarobacter incanus]|uniref:Putative membrane protein insertion efficiency factor n=1 Tax=Rarobacter incanus TaxID=153494 RepID=A0A542SQ29_9MICO|nr:hypothetical protein FB389_1375 [Rarobacter incanus]
MDRALDWYQRRISPLFGARCCYYPTCSSYARESLGRYGFFKGVVLTMWRLMKCNQFSRGGIDDVPPRFRLALRPYDKRAEQDTTPGCTSDLGARE